MDTDALYAPYRNEKTKAFNEKITKDEVYPQAGVRIPVLRSLAKTISNPDEITIRYHEDVILKGLAIAAMKAPLKEKLSKLGSMLDALSAWDHADVIASSLKPRKAEREEALAYFLKLLEDKRTFPRRLGIVYLMSHRKDYGNPGNCGGIVIYRASCRCPLRHRTPGRSDIPHARQCGSWR